MVAAEVAPAVVAHSGELPMGRAMGRQQEQFPSICLCCRKKSLLFMDGVIDREEHTLLTFNLFLRYFRVFLQVSSSLNVLLWRRKEESPAVIFSSVS